MIKTDDPPAETSPQSKDSNKTPSIEESPDSDDDDPDIPEIDASRVMSPLELLIKPQNQFIKSQVIMKDGPVITDDKNDDTQSVTGNIETENVGTETKVDTTENDRKTELIESNPSNPERIPVTITDIVSQEQEDKKNEPSMIQVNKDLAFGMALSGAMGLTAGIFGMNSFMNHDFRMR